MIRSGSKCERNREDSVGNWIRRMGLVCLLFTPMALVVLLLSLQYTIQRD